MKRALLNLIYEVSSKDTHLFLLLWRIQDQNIPNDRNSHCLFWMCNTTFLDYYFYVKIRVLSARFRPKFPFRFNCHVTSISNDKYPWTYVLWLIQLRRILCSLIVLWKTYWTLLLPALIDICNKMETSIKKVLLLNWQYLGYKAYLKLVRNGETTNLTN